jgi:hypothetical protein
MKPLFVLFTAFGFIAHSSTSIDLLTNRPTSIQIRIVSDESARKQIAQNIIDNLTKGKFEAVRTDFSGTLKREMSAQVLKDQWANVETQVGKFENVISMRIALFQGYNVVIVRCKFAVDNMNLELIFNEDDKVIGIHTKP